MRLLFSAAPVDFWPDIMRDLEERQAAARARDEDASRSAEAQRQTALRELKLQAIESAVVIERLRWSPARNSPRLDDAEFKRKVQDTAADLLFRAHLQLSV